MNSNLDARLRKLEDAGMQGTCYVAHRVDGKLVSRDPTRKLARCFAVLPAVCDSAEEWLAQYSPTF